MFSFEAATRAAILSKGWEISNLLKLSRWFFWQSDRAFVGGYTKDFLSLYSRGFKLPPNVFNFRFKNTYANHRVLKNADISNKDYPIILLTRKQVLNCIDLRFGGNVCNKDIHIMFNGQIYVLNVQDFFEIYSKLNVLLSLTE